MARKGLELIEEAIDQDVFAIERKVARPRCLPIRLGRVTVLTQTPALGFG